MKDSGSGGFERLVGVEKIKGGDYSGKLTGPERERRIISVAKMGGGDIAVAGDDDLVLMEGDERDGVAESEFVEGLDDGEERLRKHDHARVVDGAEELLQLNHGADDNEAREGEDLRGGGGEEVDAVARDDEEVGVLADGVGKSDGGLGVFGQVAGEDGEVAL